MVTLNNALYLFGTVITYLFIRQYIQGGHDGRRILTGAAKYDGTNWTHVGSLLKPRLAHRSIVIDNSIMHVGGYGLVIQNSNHFSNFDSTKKDNEL